MNNFKELEGEVLDSIILSENKDQLVFRMKSGWLVFYRGSISLIKGVHLIDSKYGVDGLAFSDMTDNGKLMYIKKDMFEGLSIQHEGLRFEGKVLESVLKSISGFSQVSEDF